MVPAYLPVLVVIVFVAHNFFQYRIYLDIYLSVLAVLDEDEQTLINANIVDKEKVRFHPVILHIF